jgi:phenylpyruvate tautomerase
MPNLTINTNIPRSKFPANFCADMTKVLADTLSKPESYCVVHVNADQMMTWAGSSEPCASCTCTSIGQLGVEPNKKHSKAIMAELNKLGIPSSRIYIHFIDSKPGDMGYNNSTFHGIL